jgi:hypothetical protein
MYMKIFYKSFIAPIFCAIIASVTFPFWLLLWMGYIIFANLKDFGTFFRNFTRSLRTPGNPPFIGLRGFYALKKYRYEALQAEADYDSQTAAASWKKCALLYDTDAMIKVAEYVAEGEFCEAPSEENCEELRQIAVQWYAVAASFGNSKAEKEYEFKTGYKISDDEKIWFRKNFIKSRSYLCKRANSLPDQEK